ncbi:MAG: oligopeptide/dipeptide ABC transporter ATP-binding protein [Promethearchaeota archaeon]
MQSNYPKREQSQLIEVSNLKKYFPVKYGFFQRIFSRKEKFIHAIDDISFSINYGEIFCLVGESGCGKTTTANVLVGLEPPTTGKFKWRGQIISHSELKPKKKHIKSQVVFQNPYSSLNPRMKLGDTILHSLAIHNRVTDSTTKKRLRNAVYAEYGLFFGSLLSFILIAMTFLLEGVIATIIAIVASSIFSIALFMYFFHSWIRKKSLRDPIVLELFDEIGLTPSLQYYTKYPHEVSGGERQRASIARAIVLNPNLLVADEPTSMLDVSLRAGILDTLKSLQSKYNISILFITHDLAAARHFGDRIGVMYAGKLVEMGNVEDIFQRPFHPYTEALIDAIPTPIPGPKDHELPKGEVPDAIRPPSGCRFHPRCPIADLSICSTEEPELIEQSPNHLVACHFPIIKK